MKLGELAATSGAVREVRSRKQKIALLAESLRRMTPEERAIGACFLAGILPDGRIGIGHASVRKMRAVPPVAEATLELADVDRGLAELAELEGKGSASARERALAGLFSRATSGEQELLSHLLMGELRQGASEGIVVEAIAVAAAVDPAAVRRALMLSGDLGEVARAALSGGDAALRGVSLQLFRPVLPMLAQPTDDIDTAIGELGEASFELKLDGARIQLHKSGDEVRVFSRRLNEVTAAVPEVVEAARGLAAREVILDGEVIALRPDGKPYPFQETMRRFGRRLDVDTLRAQMPLSPFYFDILHLDGQTLIDLPARERIAALDSAVAAAERIPREITADPQTVEELWQATLARGHEGLMAKSLDAPYEAGGRGKSWLKLKPAHTLDLVVIGVEWGSGRRRGWLSNLHLGARDPADGSFVMLGKTFKGMTDQMLAWQTERLLALEIARDEWTVYVRPELVVEIAFNDVLASPHYPGGMALRFARVKRYRPDKPASEADTIDAVRRIFAAQR